MIWNYISFNVSLTTTHEADSQMCTSHLNFLFGEGLVYVVCPSFYSYLSYFC